MFQTTNQLNIIPQPQTSSDWSSFSWDVHFVMDVLGLSQSLRVDHPPTHQSMIQNRKERSDPTQVLSLYSF
jgi:hypothetical protein